MQIYGIHDAVFVGKEWMRCLTNKQARFVREYLVDFNATQAAARAGYRGSYDTLVSRGVYNLRNPKIIRALKGAVTELGVSLPLVGKSPEVEPTGPQPDDRLKDEESDPWLLGMVRSLERKEEGKNVAIPLPRLDPFREALKRETVFREIGGEVYFWQNGGWVR